MKVQMTCRHTAITGVKLEPGFVYEFPDRYARELIDSGIAIPVTIPAPMPIPVESPVVVKVKEFSTKPAMTKFNIQETKKKAIK